MNQEELSHSEVYYWNIHEPLPENFALAPEIKHDLPEVTKYIIDILTLPVFINALVRQTDFATVGDALLKLCELNKLTDHHTLSLSTKGRRVFSDNSSGKRQRVLARALHFHEILSSQTNKIPSNRTLSEALEEIFGRIWAQTDYNFIFCLEMYARVLDTALDDYQAEYSKSRLTKDQAPQPLPQLNQKVEAALTVSKEGQINEDGLVLTDIQEFQAFMDEVFDAEEASADKPINEGNDWKVRVPDFYLITTEPKPDGGWVAYATDLDKNEIEGTRAEHKKRKSASNRTKLLLRQELGLDDDE